MRLELIYTMRDIQINSNLDVLTKFRNSIKASISKISFHGISLTAIDHKDHHSQHECQRIEKNPKEKDCDNHRQEPEQES